LARLDSVDLRLLRVLVAVVEGRGFAAAQTQLNVGASTISNHMSALETRLDVKLCKRGRAGFKLTPEGELVYDETQKLFAALDVFEFKVGTLRTRLRTSLALGIIDNTITDDSAPLHEAIGRFTRQARDVQLLVECRPPNELVREVMEGRLDVAIGSFPKVLLGLTYRKLYDETHMFYCGRTHPLFSRSDAEITDEVLSQHAVISRGYWANRDVRHIRSVRSPVNVNNMEAEARLILSGGYLGYLPSHYAEQWIRSGAMRSIRSGDMGYVAPFEIVHAPNALERSGVRRFVREVLQTFKQPIDRELGAG
jgi:DNA-binding transcriptional LysR family regulator